MHPKTLLLLRASLLTNSVGAINARMSLTKSARRIRTVVYVDILGHEMTPRNGSLIMLHADAKPILRRLKSKISIGATIVITLRTKTAARTITAVYAAGLGPRMTARSGDQRILYVDAEQKSVNLPRISSLGVTIVRI